MEADDEDTQDGDSLSHLKLEPNLSNLSIQEDVACYADSVDQDISDTVEVRLDIRLKNFTILRLKERVYPIKRQ